MIIKIINIINICTCITNLESLKYCLLGSSLSRLFLDVFHELIVFKCMANELDAHKQISNLNYSIQKSSPFHQINFFTVFKSLVIIIFFWI